jgi:hypothetical protein
MQIQIVETFFLPRSPVPNINRPDPDEEPTIEPRRTHHESTDWSKKAVHFRTCRYQPGCRDNSMQMLVGARADDALRRPALTISYCHDASGSSN